MLDLKKVIASAPKKSDYSALQTLFTPWGEQIQESAENVPSDPSLLHPHPQFARERFMLLDGWWGYEIAPSDDASSAWSTAPLPPTYAGRIRVPFSPEAPLSGVNRQLLPNELLWYRRVFTLPEEFFSSAAERCVLHFEAVDYACACYVNGRCVGTHVGGYLPFAFDITDELCSGENELVLCVHDPSDTGVQLRGKQKLERGGIWYTAQSGIWQSVWLEVVPQSHLSSVSIDANADTGVLTLAVSVQQSLGAGDSPCDSQNASASLSALQLDVRLFDGEKEVALTSTSLRTQDTAELTFSLTAPHLWSPEDPHLYRLEFCYGEDRVSSYCAFRTISMERDEQGVCRLYLNHKPYFLRGVLDQGYWPDGLLTAPSDEALIFDIEAMKELGFNMLRKHIKVESDRWYYHCDRLGMLVWQDMVSGGSPLSSWHSSYKPTFFRSSWGYGRDDTPRKYRHLSSSDEAYRSEWSNTCAHTVSYLKNHPSIITWVLFNEGWGQFDARAATNMVNDLDCSRPIDAVSGWYDQGCGDFLSVHNYFRPLEVYRDTSGEQRAFVISEFGGLSYPVPGHCALPSSYGYDSSSNPNVFKEAVLTTLAQADALEQQGLAGFVYTQLSDVEEETNGVLTYDRRVNKLVEKDHM